MKDQPRRPSSQGTATNGHGRKLVVVAGVGLTIVAAIVLLWDTLSLDYLAQREAVLREIQTQHPILVYVAAYGVYVTVTGLSIPGATALSLLYAWYFGFWPAVVLVSFASTTGATLAFLLSRYLLRESIQTRFGDRLQLFNEALEREGAFYLFTLRLIPAVPFFVINVVMGLTRIRVSTFWWVSQLGMLAGTVVYVYAGASIPDLAQLADPSQLRRADLSHPRGLARQLAANSKNALGLRLRQSMSEDARDWLDDFAAGRGEPNADQTSRLASILNEVIIRVDFGLWSEPLSSGLAPAESADPHSSAQKELTARNRELLVRTFPDYVLPPRPIVSTQLLIAFCVLGCFPLVVKRFNELLRASRSSPAETA